MAVLWNNASKPRSENILLQRLECYKDTQMKAYEITKLTAELKSDNVQYRNKMIFIIAAVLFLCRRSIATGSSAVAPYSN